MKIKQEDITIEYDCKGYRVFYKDKCIKETVSLGHKKEHRYALKHFKEEAEINRMAILSGFIPPKIKQKIIAIDNRRS